MVIAWLSRLIASLLVTVLSATIISVVLNQTVLTSHYLEGQLTATNSYARLSDTLSAQVAQDSGNVDPAVTAKVKTILTPEALRQKINDALEQLQAYYQGKGPLPTIDLSDLAAQAEAAGVPLGNNTDLTKPITFGKTSVTDTDATASTGPDLRNLTKLGGLVSLVLALVLALLCWKRREYRPLANVLISLGFSFGLVALFAWLAPGLVDRAIKLNSSSNSFISISHDVVVAIAHDLAKRFGIIAICSLVLGIVARIVIKRLTTLRLKQAAPPPPRPIQTV